MQDPGSVRCSTAPQVQPLALRLWGWDEECADMFRKNKKQLYKNHLCILCLPVFGQGQRVDFAVYCCHPLYRMEPTFRKHLPFLCPPPLVLASTHPDKYREALITCSQGRSSQPGALLANPTTLNSGHSVSSCLGISCLGDGAALINFGFLYIYILYNIM